jgi:hypothetical protein
MVIGRKIYFANFQASKVAPVLMEQRFDYNKEKKNKCVLVAK